MVLKNCNLKHYRQLHHPVRSKYGQLQMTRKQALIALHEQSNRLQELATCIDIFFTDIISERFLRQEIGGARLFNSLVYGFKGRVKERKGFSYILKWLGIKYTQTICWQQVQQEAKTNKDQFVNVEDDTKQKARNMFVEGDEENRIYLEENAKTLLRKIRKETGSVFYVDQEMCTMKNKNMSWEERTEIKYYRRLKDTIERKLSDPDIMTQEDAETIQDVWRLDHNAKWRLYRLWIQQLCLKQYEKIETERSQFEEASERYREAVLQEEKEIMRQASVIGMTTSGAARYQSVLRDICPRIIIVEEAAEVLEAHIITTLSKGCEHLILIGDHKQLRPNPNVYKLATRYKLNISLFERMIKNGMSYNTLELQHRMRPEISSIVKHIYPDLQDHEHVKEYPPVKGVSENVFLINHTHPETTDKELRSYSNMFEAQYVPALCRYLLQQGYGRRGITILTTYTGQLLCMRKFMPKEEFQGVKITVVDNYQGEENEIVILSLVRSNDIEKIGFLKTENRICVALSRAKVGFFILGNFNHLATHSSLWKKIVDEMKDKNKLGDGLPLYCQNHPRKQLVIASTYSDFRKAPEGGCSDICNIRLKCGHKCRKYCHILDMTHSEYKCTQKCTKQLCELGHVCPDKCSATCGPCRIMVSKTMPICGHTQIMQCSVDPLKFSCREPCEKSLKCGHRCMEKCGESHTSKCKKIVNHKWSCSHEAEIECWKTVMPNIDRLCPQPCAAILECEHVCGGTCGKCFSGRVHEPCQQDCKRILVCGHGCKASCSNCPPCRERCQNRCVHSICDKHCGELCTSCTERCSWECAHFSCTKLCHEPCDRPRCNEPCAYSIPKCGHPCIGLCGEPCPSLCKICDKDEVTEIFFGNEDEIDAKFVLLEDCNHIVESVGMDEYMDKEDGDYSIQLNTCPKCKTPIRKCLRYGTLINRTLADAERVKTEIIGDLTKMNVVKSKLNKATRSSILPFTMRLRYTRTSSSIDSRLSVVSNRLNGRLEALEASGFYSERQLATIENQYIIAEAIINVRHAIRLERSSYTSGNEKELNMRTFLKELLQIILKDKNFLTEQEIEDFKREIERGTVWVKYLKIEKARRMLTCKEDPEEVSADKKKLIALVFETKLFTEDDREEANECIERLKTHMKVGSLGITDDERLEIVNAVGLRKGHWFKCPNNHIYAIGDCGGASEKSICPECKAEIGGVHHRLTEGNKLAPEMDGAPYAAYSEDANNMGNFDLNNLH